MILNMMLKILLIYMIFMFTSWAIGVGDTTLLFLIIIATRGWISFAVEGKWVDPILRKVNKMLRKIW